MAMLKNSLVVERKRKGPEFWWGGGGGGGESSSTFFGSADQKKEDGCNSCYSFCCKQSVSLGARGRELSILNHVIVLS